MALFTQQQLFDRARNQYVGGISNTFSDTGSIKARAILNEARAFQESPQGRVKTYDIFLSHSTTDAREVTGLKLLLEDMGYSVYVDWIEDPQLNRANVNKATAAVLKLRMHTCRSLFYAFSDNSSASKWMPWELGYFDGVKQKAAVLPIKTTPHSSDSFQGTEYLSLYHYITVGNDTTGKRRLWVHESDSSYTVYEEWLNSNRQPYQR